MSSESDQRVKRPHLSRSGPNRNPANVFRPPSPTIREPLDPTPPAEPPPPRNQEEVVVDSAYQVLHESMRKGQEAARRYPHVYSGMPSMRDEHCPHCNSASPPMMFWNQMYGLWSSMASSMMQSFMSPPGHAHSERGWGRDYDPDEASSHHPAHESSAHHEEHHRPHHEPQHVMHLKVLVQSNSTRLLDADVNIFPGSDLASLTVMPLHALDNPAGNALTGTITRVGQHTIRLQLVVAPEQPKGTYVGALYDRAWKEVRGSVQVDLQD